MFVQEQWLGSLQPCPALLTEQPWVGGMGLTSVCVYVHPWFVQDSLLGHLFYISLFSSLQGEEYLKLLSAVFGQRHTVSLCHWSFAALLEVLKSSRSHQELRLMGCFSWAEGIVCTLLLQSKWELNKDLDAKEDDKSILVIAEALQILSC